MGGLLPFSFFSLLKCCFAKLPLLVHFDELFCVFSARAVEPWFALLFCRHFIFNLCFFFVLVSLPLCLVAFVLCFFLSFFVVSQWLVPSKLLGTFVNVPRVCTALWAAVTAMNGVLKGVMTVYVGGQDDAGYIARPHLHVVGVGTLFVVDLFCFMTV